MNVTAIFLPGQTDITVNGLHQWDYGQRLEIKSDDLPALIEVHFSCVGMTEAIVRNCFITNGTGTVAIPDICLEQAAPITAWIFEIDGTTGTTTKTITLPIISRARPTTGDVVPEEISDKYTEAITEINSLIGAMTKGDITVANAERATEAASAEYASRAGEAEVTTFAQNAGQINGLMLRRINGILKIGDIVIPQRKLAFDGVITIASNASDIHYDEDNSLQGRTFELVTAKGEVYAFTVGEFANETNVWEQYINSVYIGEKDVETTYVRLWVKGDSPKVLWCRVQNSGTFEIRKIYEIIQ